MSVNSNNNRMIQQKSSHRLHSDGDGFSDMQYKIEISDRKSKQGQNSKQELFDFDDFRDFKEVTSQLSQGFSMRKINPSEKVKRSEESFNLNEFGRETLKNRTGSISIEGMKFTKSEESQDMYMPNAKDFGSPTFNNENVGKGYVSPKKFSKTQDMKFSDHTAVRQNQQNLHQNKQMFSSKRSLQLPKEHYEPGQSKQISYNVSSSRAALRNVSNKPNIEEQFSGILAQIHYYESQAERIEYETIKSYEQIRKYEHLMANDTSLQSEFIHAHEQTRQLNQLINNQVSIEKALLHQKSILEGQIEQATISVDSLQFPKPTIIRDDTRQLLKQIEALKAEFHLLVGREELELTLPGETTLRGNKEEPTTRFSLFPDKMEEFQESRPTIDPEQQIMAEFIKQIAALNAASPRYAYNTKMAAMKQDWKIYQNSQLCVNCSTRSYPNMDITLGNKSSKDLLGFSIRQAAVTVSSGQVFTAHSYYKHGYYMSKLSQPFLKLEITYYTEQDKQLTEITLYLPTLPLKHGEFMPFSHKQYQLCLDRNRHEVEQIVSEFKPLDSDIIGNSVEQFLLLYPNLLYELTPHGQKVCKGIFQLYNGNGQRSLIQIRQKGHCASVVIRNSVPFLMHSLQFVLLSLC